MTSKKRRLLLAKMDEIQGLIAQAKSLHVADIAERDKVIQARDLEVIALKRRLAIIADMAAGTNVRAFGGGGRGGMSFAEFRKQNPLVVPEAMQEHPITEESARQDFLLDIVDDRPAVHQAAQPLWRAHVF